VKNPEQQARQTIDAALAASGWVVQDYEQMNLAAAQGVAVREFPLAFGFGRADYALYVSEELVGAVEAKKEGVSFASFETQTQKYSDGVPAELEAPIRPLPFLYQSTGIETHFTNRLDPVPRRRQLFSFHRPETLANWLAKDPIFLPLVNGQPDPRSLVPASLRMRLRAFPDLEAKNLWPAQRAAVGNLEKSLYEARPRALIQMATGSGKTFTAITSIYRLIKFGGAERVLFLVDRSNLGKQALKEFQQYTTPDDGRKFTELYNVQLLSSNKVDPVARVVITTIQRLYSMLKGEAELDPELEERSGYETLSSLVKEPVPVEYNAGLPIEAFDFVFVDECHRSIYSLWRQALEYFDAFLVGLTATPGKQTFGFFGQNLVMEYGHSQAVADGVNVDYDVYKIRTRITDHGATVEAGPEQLIGRRDRQSRRVRWETLDDDLAYDPNQLDRNVVAKDQIRTIVRTFRDRLFTEIFPGRREVPKTLIFAKDDSHADDIVEIIRDEFAQGNDFCQKITYRTSTVRVVESVTDEHGVSKEQIVYKSSGVKPEDLLSEFRTRYNPRIVVTVDMIATGTDVKPLEIVLFMRAVKSRNFFEQMKGRGVRVINPHDLKQVTPDADGKDRFVLIDCVGVCEQDLNDSLPLEQQRTVGFGKLIEAVQKGSLAEDVLSSLAGRLARIDRRIGKPEREELAKLAGGKTIAEISADIVEALEPDRQIEEARRTANLPPDAEPTPKDIDQARKALLRRAVAPLKESFQLRERLIDVKKSLEQSIDETSRDELTEARYDPHQKQLVAEKMVTSFRDFIEKHKDEITALQVLYSKPYARRLSHQDIQDLAELIQAPPRKWTPDVLWRAYDALDHDKVKGASSQRLLTDIVSLVRFTLHQEPELVPYAERVRARFDTWLTQQESQGRAFTEDQREWLVAIRDHVAANLEIEIDDLEFVPFNTLGGPARALKIFGPDLRKILAELNEALAA
jgi:type I restriction enzyme, R subunit